jgi:hypothetical protein
LAKFLNRHGLGIDFDTLLVKSKNLELELIRLLKSKLLTFSELPYARFDQFFLEAAMILEVTIFTAQDDQSNK